MLLFLLTVQIVCCVAVFISCGMAYNLNYVEEQEVTHRDFSLSFEKNSDISGAAHVKNDLGEITDVFFSDGRSANGERRYTWEHEGTIPVGESREKINEFVEEIKKFGIRKMCLYLYSSKITNLKESYAYEYTSQIPGFQKYDNNTASYVDSIANVLLAPVTVNGERNPLCPYDVGGTYELGGKTFKCVGEYKFYFIPYNVIPDEFVIHSITVVFENKIYQSDINSIIDSANSIFGSDINEIFAPEPYEPMALQLSTMLFVISIVVMIIIILAISKLYSFVLAERKKTLAIMRLCGCRRGETHTVYMLEIILTMLLSLTVGFLIFRFILLEPISAMYPSFEDFYRPMVYPIILGAYFLISVAVMMISIIPSTKATIADMKK